MSLSPGAAVGPYRIVALLGAGGMGEVYRATDAKLQRDVAIKVLPAAVAADPARLARFTREAQTLAALNHPHIAAIYGVEGSALVMELVEGNDLAEMIASRSLALDDTIAIARQIAEALEAAHEAGIVHRDLKPANVKVRPDGTVKVLDFGLAKAMGTAEGAPGGSLANSPTLTTPAMTEAGMILGTAAYMSPEQARGRLVDRRADIWAFGCVLYEMLAGVPAFHRDTVTDTLSAILRDDPDWAPLAGLPPRLDALLHRCLEKDPRLRLRDIGEARILLGESDRGGKPAAAAPAAAMGTPAAEPRSSLAVLAITGLVTAAIAGGVTWLAMRRGPAPVSFAPGIVKITTDAGFTIDPAVAANGSLIAYASDRGGEGLDLWVQPLPGGEPVRITHDPADDREPDFSPDGSRLVFRSERDGGGIYEVPALGGAERLVAARGRTPKFSPDGKWIAYLVGGRAVRTAAWITDGRGGAPREVAPSIEFGREPRNFASFASLLWCPDGKSILGVGGMGGDAAAEDWFAVDVASGAATRLGVAAVMTAAGLEPGGPAAWLGDEIVFGEEGESGSSLWAVPMHGCRAVAGPPHRLTMGTGQDLSPVSVATPDGLRLFYANGDRRTNIYRLPLPAALDAPTVVALTDDAASNLWPSVSSDGRMLGYLGRRAGEPRVIVRDLATRSAIDIAVADRMSAISPDGRRIATLLEGVLSLRPVAGGDARQLTVAGGMRYLWDWPRPRLVTGSRSGDAGVTAIAVNLETGAATPILDSPGAKFLGHARLSPDGKWMSLMNWTSADRGGVVVVPYDGVTAARADQIVPITDGEAVAEESAWSADGNTLYVVSETDGYRCIWSRRLDPATRRPVGPLTPEAHFHRARLQIASTDASPQRLDMSPDGLVFAMAERHGNIWMATVKK